MSYFSEQLQLLKLEREADLLAFKQENAALTVPEKRAKGLLWYPIIIKSSELGRGDYLTIEVERPNHQHIAHQFGFGKSVVFFSTHDIDQYRVEGIVTHASAHILKVNFRIDELPEWHREGKLGIELLFDNHSYDEMNKALQSAQKRLQNDENVTLINVLLGKQSATYKNGVNYNNKASALNLMQQQALSKILSANELAIVHGPPGTGKTTTLIEAVLALQQQNKHQVLVVAPSNTAVDLLSAKLSDKGFNVVRVGNPLRVSDKLTALTLDFKIAEHKYSREVKQFKKQAAEFKNMAHKYKRNFGRSEREQRKALFDEAHKILKQAENTEQFIIEDILNKADVITATLVGANHYTIQDRKYQTVIIDEAGQALEPACWIPLLKAEKVVLAGDYHQLQATVKSHKAHKDGFGVTLMEKCVINHPETVILLEEQYRMHPLIMGYSSTVFYQGKLKAHSSVADNLLFKNDLPVEFIDTAGCGFEEKLVGKNISNPDEAVFLLKHLSSLVKQLDSRQSIAIITPYREQVDVIKELLSDYPALSDFLENISVNTVDSFQGQERDVVYIGLTRSNTNNNIGFLTDIKRINVAITRARKKLVVIGDSITLSKHDFYDGFISYVEQSGGYKSAWEFIDSN